VALIFRTSTCADGPADDLVARTCPDTRPSATGPVRDSESLATVRIELVQRFNDLPTAIVDEVLDRCISRHAAATNRFYVPALVNGEAVRELVQRRRSALRGRSASALTSDDDSWLKDESD